MSVIPLKVVVRVRPLIQKEKDEGCQTCLNFIPYEPQIVLGKDRSFTYDFVFRPTDPQITVYEDAVKPLVEHIFRGYNATVLAYGQTGSGKTFTMGGGYEDSLKMDPEGMGIIPRIVQEIFSAIAEKETYKFKTSVSYLEIINEDLQDLLSSKKESLTIREENGVIKLPGQKELPVTSTEETMKYLEQGCNNRTTAATAMNNSSSRSHAIFSLTIEQHNEEDINDFWKAKLQLVDLAGSERIKKTHAEGARLKEGININKGLLALGNVISILGDETKKASHVPYRDSKLTRILQDSLGGNSHTLMIACVSPADSNMEETLNTLRYADRARKIKNKPVVNWDPQTAEIMRLKAQVQQLTVKLISAGLTDLDSDDVNIVKKESPKKDSKTLQMWIDKCHEFETQVNNLHKDLCCALDQVSESMERTVRWENKWERLKALLTDFEDTVGVDFDLLSSTITDETNPVVTEQLDKLKGLFNKLHNFMKDSREQVDESASTNTEAEDDAEEGEVKTEDSEVPCTPESQERMKQHAQNQAYLNKQLVELTRNLEMKEKLAKQMAQNDQMKELKQQYEVSMKQFEDEIASLQKEKEDLTSALEDARTNAAASKLSEARRKRLLELETQMAELKRKLSDQKKLLKVKDQTDKKVTQLNTEIQSLKHQRVDLMKKLRQEADQWRKWRQEKDKEVLQLQQKDRKRQFEIQKLQRENQRTQSVLQRKSEEAAAANRRLKEALAKQKQVIEERNLKFEKSDKNSIGNRIRKLLCNELDVQVSMMEAKYHRESLLQDRKTLAEQLKSLKESLNDAAPPSKKMAWMDETGTKHETSFQEDEIKKKIHHLEQQIELMNVQIQDFQQKIFDGEQECKGKATKDNLHTMMEAKIAIKWLLDQAVTFKADQNRLQLELNELKLSESNNHNDNEEILTDLEDQIAMLKREHERKVTRLLSEHQEEIEVLLQSAERKPSASSEKEHEEVSRLRQENEKLKKTTRKLEQHLTKYMFKDKTVALLPDLTDDETEPPEARSPFIAQRPKLSIASRSVLGIIQTEEPNRSSDEFEKPPRPPIRKSVSAGMLRNKRSSRSSAKQKVNDEEEWVPKKTLKKKSSTSDLTESIEEETDDKEQYVRKLRKRSARFNLRDILADEATDTNDEAEDGEVPKKTKTIKRKSSKTNLQKVESLEDCIADTPNTEKHLTKKTSKSKLKKLEISPKENIPEQETFKKPANLNETFTSVSEDSEKSASLNETFTASKDDDLDDELDEGLKKKRKLFNSTKSFFKPVEFADCNV